MEGEQMQVRDRLFQVWLSEREQYELTRLAVQVGRSKSGLVRSWLMAASAMNQAEVSYGTQQERQRV